MKKFNELTEQEKISRTKYSYLGVGLLTGVLTMLFIDLYIQSKHK